MSFLPVIGTVGWHLPAGIALCQYASRGWGWPHDQIGWGRDLVHLREIEKIAVGVASIGGAGTFDGIALSGIIAACLA